MKGSKIFLVVFLLLGIYVQPSVEAAGKVFLGTTEYILSGNMTNQQAETEALALARQNAQDQAGTYLLSYSESQNGAIKEEALRTLASGLAELVDGTIRTSYKEDSGRKILYLQAEFMILTDQLEEKMRELTRKTEEASKKMQADALISEGDEIMLRKVTLASGRRSKYVDGIVLPLKFEKHYEEYDDTQLFLGSDSREEKRKIKQEVHQTYAEGLEKYRQAVALAPTYPLALCRLAAAVAGYGPLKTKTQRKEESLRLLSQVLTLNPTHQDALWYYARIDYDASMRYYKRLFTANPGYSSRVGNILGYFSMEKASVDEAKGYYAVAKRGYEESLAIFEKTSEFAPDDNDYAVNLWLNYLYLAQLDMKMDNPLDQVMSWTNKASEIYVRMEQQYKRYWLEPYSRLRIAGTEKFKKLREDYLLIVNIYLQQRFTDAAELRNYEKKLTEQIIPPDSYIYRNIKGLGMFEDP